jgi:S-adenosylmethionine-dependent methyltransferase
MQSGSVEGYYDESPQREWDRLDSDRVEFAVTLRALDEFLPTAPGAILDIGGGPGRYTIALAQRGHAVTLADLSRGNVDFALARAAEAGVTLAGAEHADARDLSRFADASFDAVLLMGPLYHLLDESDRRTAVGEALRVLRPGGRMFAAFITRYAPLRFWGKYNPTFAFENRETFDAMIATGRAPNLTGFTDVHLERPDAVVPFMETAGLSTVALIGCEGVVSMIRDRINELSGDAWAYWVDMNYRVGQDPATHGTAEHLLHVGRKP